MYKNTTTSPPVSGVKTHLLRFRATIRVLSARNPGRNRFAR